MESENIIQAVFLRIPAMMLAAAFLLCLPPAFAERPLASYILIEADSGDVIAEENADLKRPPASMLKMMQMLLVSEGIDKNIFTLDRQLTVSKHAQGMGGTQVYLEAGEVWPLGHLMRAVAVASANDAAMAVAEGLWGTEARYLAAMNRRARELGMLDTTFHSVHGLPPDRGDAFDVSTARDMALLARECVKHERILRWSREKEFQFRPGKAVSYNTNKMLWRMENCDGLKTGYIRKAGFCVSATAEREGRRLICVIMGMGGSTPRFRLAKNLMEDAFTKGRRVIAVRAGEPVAGPLSLPGADIRDACPVALEDIALHLQEAERDRLRIVHEYNEHRLPPVSAGEPVGQVQVELDGVLLGATPLIAPADIQPLRWWLVLRDGHARWEHFANAGHDRIN
jgi:serine-type D-Ala-D-Ala carboxypeptidase (penicillin-binding protein 5/6)